LSYRQFIYVAAGYRAIINKLLVEMGKKTELQPACRDYTMNLHKNL